MAFVERETVIVSIAAGSNLTTVVDLVADDLVAAVLVSLSFCCGP
jgi:hypothetical protein